MTCTHAWVVTGIAEIDDELMETQGHLLLTCAKCSAIARLERPTYYECYLAAKGWLRGEETCFTDSAGGDDRLVIVLEGARADDLLTAGDDESIDSAGTMGWLPVADDPPQVQLTLRRGNADEFNDDDHHQRPAVADLVDGLDLFEGDDDVPF